MRIAIALLISGLTSLAASAAVAVDSAPPKAKTAKYKIDKRGAGELFTTTDKLQVFAAPKAGSKVLQEYNKGAMMAVLGEATGTGYLYVSPCNACDSGFVSKIEFQARTKR
jgi:hypothetical protein